jgi:DNA polymerase
VADVAGLGCTSLEQLRELVGECGQCCLAPTRSNIVFGVGNPHASVMLIGEAPGRNEDLKGEPFVGAAGKLLDELLAHAGLCRDDVYIANVLKCRPPGNRDPEPAEIDACAPFLREQIRLVDPQVLVTLGNFATRFVLKTRAGITALRGKPTCVGRFTVLPIFHPAAAIYDRTKRERLFEDFELLARLLESRPDNGCASSDKVSQRQDDEGGPGPCSCQPRSHSS